MGRRRQRYVSCLVKARYTALYGNEYVRNFPSIAWNEVCARSGLISLLWLHVLKSCAALRSCSLMSAILFKCPVVARSFSQCVNEVLILNFYSQKFTADRKKCAVASVRRQCSILQLHRTRRTSSREGERVCVLSTMDECMRQALQ